MLQIRIRLFLAALALVALATPAAFADYMTQTVNLTYTTPGASIADVRIEAYDGNGPAGGGLSAGQVRLTFEAVPPPQGGGLPAGGNGNFTFEINGLQSVAFNTDLSLNPSQITAPANWSLQNNVSYGTLGTFSFAAGTAQALQNNVSLLISGLGTDATPSHFLVGSQGGSGGPTTFAAQWVDLTFNPTSANVATQVLTGNASADGGDPNSTPEPSALVLAGLGLAGALGLRRRAGRAPGKPAG